MNVPSHVYLFHIHIQYFCNYASVIVYPKYCYLLPRTFLRTRSLGFLSCFFILLFGTICLKFCGSLVGLWRFECIVASFHAKLLYWLAYFPTGCSTPSFCLISECGWLRSCYSCPQTARSKPIDPDVVNLWWKLSRTKFMNKKVYKSHSASINVIA